MPLVRHTVGQVSFDSGFYFIHLYIYKFRLFDAFFGSISFKFSTSSPADFSALVWPLHDSISTHFTVGKILKNFINNNNFYPHSSDKPFILHRS